MGRKFIYVRASQRWCTTRKLIRVFEGCGGPTVVLNPERMGDEMIRKNLQVAVPNYEKNAESVLLNVSEKNTCDPMSLFH